MKWIEIEKNGSHPYRNSLRRNNVSQSLSADEYLSSPKKEKREAEENWHNNTENEIKHLQTILGDKGKKIPSLRNITQNRKGQKTVWNKVRLD